MKNQRHFLKCDICGNVVGMIDDMKANMVCCGQAMRTMTPNTVDASQEKHIPVARREGDNLIVNVGSALHPMTEEHHIDFIYIETENGGKRRCLKVGQEPTIKVCYCDDKPVAVYAYCNLHGMWKTEIE